MPVAAGLVEVAGGVAADRHLDGRVDVARAEAIARGALAIDVDLHGRLAERIENREVGHAAHGGQHRFDLGRGVGDDLEVVAEQLDRILTLHAGDGLGDVVLQILREIELDAWKFGLQRLEHLVGEAVLVEIGAPLAYRLERHEKLGVEEAGGIGAVIRPAVLRDDRLHLREARDDPAHPVDVAVALLQRDGRRQRGANPEIALFELGQELESQQADSETGDHQQHDGNADHRRLVTNREAQHRRVDAMQRAHHQRLGLLHVLGQYQRAQRRRDGERRDQAAGQRIRIGLRHRAEDVAFDAAQREQRDEARDDDAGGKEYRAVDVGRGVEDREPLAVQAGRRKRPDRFLGRFVAVPAQPAEDALDHDDGGIDDQAEVDRSHRKQIGGLAAYDQDADGHEQRERDGHADDHGAAKVAEKRPLQEEDQPDADDHVVKHGRRRDVDQVLAVVDALDPHAGGQEIARVDPLDLGLHALNGRHALLAAAHQHDALDDIVVVVLAGDAEPRLVGDLDIGDVADDDRHAAGLRQHGVADFVERADQADAANHGDLGPDVDGAAADIDVAVVQRLQHLRQRDAVGDQLVDVDLELVGLGLAAPAGDVDDARHGAEAALQDPVLQGLEIEHAEVRRAGELVAVDFTDRADRGNLRLRAGSAAAAVAIAGSGPAAAPVRRCSRM